MSQVSTFIPAPGRPAVSALLETPQVPSALVVLAHGAGANMHHSFMNDMSAGLVRLGFACMRYQFPYMELGNKRIDSRPLLLSTVSAAVAHGASLFPGLPLFAAGKSMGGRMSSGAAAETGLIQARGLIFYGFPLHATGKPSSERGDHLALVQQPMLFLQGTRDTLADLNLLEPICNRISHAQLHIVNAADHSFQVRKKDGRTYQDVIEELLVATRAFIERLLD